MNNILICDIEFCCAVASCWTRHLVTIARKLNVLQLVFCQNSYARHGDFLWNYISCVCTVSFPNRNMAFKWVFAMALITHLVHIAPKISNELIKQMVFLDLHSRWCWLQQSYIGRINGKCGHSSMLTRNEPTNNCLAVAKQ